MNVFKIIFSLSTFLFLNLTTSASSIDFSCLKSRSDDKYLDESIRLIVSGFHSNPKSVCLNQELFNFFKLTLTDISDRPIAKPIILKNDFKFFILNKEYKKSGKLFVTYKIINGNDSFVDKFSLYFYDNSVNRQAHGCVAFFDLPSLPFLKDDCQKNQK